MRYHGVICKKSNLQRPHYCVFDNTFHEIIHYKALELYVTLTDDEGFFTNLSWRDIYVKSGTRKRDIMFQPT